MKLSLLNIQLEDLLSRVWFTAWFNLVELTDSNDNSYSLIEFGWYQGDFFFELFYYYYFKRKIEEWIKSKNAH